MKTVKLSSLKENKVRRVSKEAQQSMVELYCIADIILDYGANKEELNCILERATTWLINDEYFSNNTAIPQTSEAYEIAIKRILGTEDIDKDVLLYILKEVLIRNKMNTSEPIKVLEYLDTLDLKEPCVNFNKRLQYLFYKGMKIAFRENKLNL